MVPTGSLPESQNTTSGSSLYFMVYFSKIHCNNLLPPNLKLPKDYSTSIISNQNFGTCLISLMLHLSRPTGHRCRSAVHKDINLNIESLCRKTEISHEFDFLTKRYTDPHSTSPWPDNMINKGRLYFYTSSTLKIICFIAITFNFSGKNTIAGAVPDEMVFT